MPRFLITETVEYLVQAEGRDEAEGLYLDHGEDAPAPDVRAVVEAAAAGNTDADDLESMAVTALAQPSEPGAVTFCGVVERIVQTADGC